MDYKNNIILFLAFSWLVFNFLGMEMRHVFPSDMFSCDYEEPILSCLHLFSLLFCVCYVGLKKLKLLLYVLLLHIICPRIDSWYKNNLIKEDPCIAYATCHVESDSRGRYSITYHYNDTKGKTYIVTTRCSREVYLLIKNRSGFYGEILVAYSKQRPDCSRIRDWTPTKDSLTYYKTLDSLNISHKGE